MTEPGDDDITDVFDWGAASWRRLRSTTPSEYDGPDWDAGDWPTDDNGEPIDVPEYTGDESGIRYLPNK